MKKYHKLLGAGGSALLVVLIGSLLFHFVEEWRYFDALYYSVITLTTVGYGDFTPQTDLGKWISIFYILFGIGILLSFINILSEHREETARIKLERKMKRQEQKMLKAKKKQ